MADNLVPNIPPATPTISPQSVGNALGVDPFSRIMGNAAPSMPMERPASMQPAPEPALPENPAPLPEIFSRNPQITTPPVSRMPPPPARPVPVEPVAPTPEELVRDALGAPGEKNVEENMKEMRRTQSALKREKEEKETELLEARTRLAKYESGEEVAEPVKQREKSLQEQVEKLKPFEQLHALKLSEDYEREYVQPLDDLGNKAIQLAKDYQVEPSIVSQAYRFENKRDRNAFLKKNGFDDVGIVELSGMIDQANALKTRQKEAEARPAETLEQLRSQRAVENTRKENERISRLHSNATSGMEKALEKIKTTEHPEFKFTGDAKQDEYVEGILSEAQKNYSNIVKVLAAKGTTELPPEVAEALAETCLYGCAGSVAMASRNDHYKRAEEIKHNAERESSMIRPRVGASAPYGNGRQERTLRTPTGAADELLRTVGLQK